MKRNSLLPKPLKSLSDRVRVLSTDGTQLGIMTVFEAQKLAANQNAELLVLTRNARPPVARIVDEATKMKIRKAVRKGGNYP